MYTALLRFDLSELTEHHHLSDLVAICSPAHLHEQEINERNGRNFDGAR